MKKNHLIIFSALVFSVECQAQLKVDSNGNIQMGGIYSTYNFSLSKHNYAESTTRFGWNSLTFSNGMDAIGQYNQAISLGALKSSIASLNLAQNSNGVYNIGVIGAVPQYIPASLPYNLTGFNAGVYGISSDNLGGTSCPVPLGQGSYAGYFVGNTYVDGVLTATSIITPSDMRLKENVEPLDVTERGESILANVMNMNVIQYNYKDREYETVDVNADLPEDMKEVIAEFAMNYADEHKPMTEKQKDLHFGLSAQELQEIFPNLIREGQDGYLGVNYTELVPVLICCIQELKQELDDLKGTDTQMKAKTNASFGETTTVIATTANRNHLFQNTPNPFKEQTVIRFSLADDVKNASVCIFDMQGKMLQSHPVQAGMDSITVNGYELGAGMFLYSLVVNGQEVDTKKMILSK